MKNGLMYFLLCMIFSPCVFGYTNPTVCIEKKTWDATYFVSTEEYAITCNDGKNYKSEIELRLLYIPTQTAEKSLNKFMEERGLNLVSTLKFIDNRMDDLEHHKDWTLRHKIQDALQYKFQIFASNGIKDAVKDIVLVKRDDLNMITGLKNVPRHDFIYTSLSYQSQNKSFAYKRGFTSLEFYQYFHQLGYENILFGKNKEIFDDATIHIFAMKK